MGETISTVQDSITDATTSAITEFGKEFGFDSHGGSHVRSVLEGTGPDQRLVLLLRLESMAQQKIMFRHVAVWRQAFLGGTADHHTVVYEYPAASCLMSLKIDWGRDGIGFVDSPEDPCPNGDIIKREWCHIGPREVASHIRKVQSKMYDLVCWNCQHFSEYLYASSRPQVHSDAILEKPDLEPPETVVDEAPEPPETVVDEAGSDPPEETPA